MNKIKEKHKKIVEMRLEGMTLKAIANHFDMAKSSVSQIVSKSLDRETNKELSLANNALVRPKQIESLSLGQKRYLHKLRSDAYNRWTSLLSSYPNKEFIAYIAGLYAGEGAKGGTFFTLTNSNPQILLDHMRFIKEVLQLDRSRIIISLYLHTSMNEGKCKEFWSEKGLAPDYVRSIDDRPKKKAIDAWEGRYYGVLQIYVRSPLKLREALFDYVADLIS